MKTTIEYGFASKKKSKLWIVVLLFPWSAVILPAIALGDKIAHSLGFCLGL